MRCCANLLSAIASRAPWSLVMGRGGRVEYAAGFGFADIERQLPFTPDTPTDDASMSPQGIVPPRGPARLEDGRSTGITLGSLHGSADGRRQT